MALTHQPIITPVGARSDVGTAQLLACVACAASTGVHVALVPEHYREGGWVLAGAFLLSALALGACALLLRQPPSHAWALVVPIGVLLTVAGCYLLSRTTGIPLLIPQAEEADPLGVLTTSSEVLAAAAVAWTLATRKEAR
jgi:drug/metabolite transporter (DMT)-like permease